MNFPKNCFCKFRTQLKFLKRVKASGRLKNYEKLRLLFWWWEKVIPNFLLCAQDQNIMIKKRIQSEFWKNCFLTFKTQMKFLKRWSSPKDVRTPSGRRPDAVRTSLKSDKTSPNFLAMGKGDTKNIFVYSRPKYYDLKSYRNRFLKKLFLKL